MCVPGNRAASLPSPLTRIRLLADVQSLLIIRPSINLMAHSWTFTNVASILFYFLFPLLTRLTPSCSCCKVSIVCALGSAHSGPRDACVALSTTQHVSAPLQRPRTPRLLLVVPLLLFFTRCFALATMQVPLPPDRESPPASLAMPAIFSMRHKTACQPTSHTSSSMLRAFGPCSVRMLWNT